MWLKEYRDYPRDTPVIKEQVEPTQGIIGCEMHEIYGWSNRLHMPARKRKSGLIATLLHHWFG